MKVIYNAKTGNITEIWCEDFCSKKGTVSTKFKSTTYHKSELEYESIIQFLRNCKKEKINLQIIK